MLQEVYGEGCLHNLSQLAVESDECRALVDQVLFQPFWDAMVRSPMGLTLQTRPFANQPVFFWKLVLRQALHSASLGMFSDKSTLAFLERIQKPNQPLLAIRPGWLQCRKDYGVYLEQDGSVHVLYPTVFPWSKADQYQLPDDSIEVTMPPPQQQMNDSQQSLPCDPVQVSVGPWILSVHVIDSCTIKEQQQSGQKKDEWDALLETPALASMKDLMRGSFSYYLRVPVVSVDNNHNNTASQENAPETNVVRLVFTKFTKATRPRAWKGFDTKVQETLPLLGVDSSSTRADDASSTNGPTRVALVQVQFGLSETH